MLLIQTYEALELQIRLFNGVWCFSPDFQQFVNLERLSSMGI
jgi:hypothetical protein